MNEETLVKNFWEYLLPWPGAFWFWGLETVPVLIPLPLVATIIHPFFDKLHVHKAMRGGRNNLCDPGRKVAGLQYAVSPRYMVKGVYVATHMNAMRDE